MTKYFIYRGIDDYARSRKHVYEAIAVIDDIFCVYREHSEPETYEHESEVGEIALGTYDGREYEVILETTSIEEFLEHLLIPRIDVGVVNSIRRICL